MATVAVPARLEVDGKSLEPEAEHTLFSLNILSGQGLAGLVCSLFAQYSSDLFL